jgi:RNA-binding signal recognition particle 68
MTLYYTLSQEPLEDSTTTAVAAADETLRLERQDLFVTRADTVLRPLFRYCQYELKQQQQQQHQAGHDDNNEEEATIQEPRLAHILHPTPTTAASSSNGDESNLKCSFRGIELVLDVKELRVLLLKLDSTASEQQQQQQETEESFLNALSILDDALEVVARQLATLNKKTQQTGPAVQAKVRQYLLWKGYLQHQKTLRVMDHTSRLLETVTTHAERVHIYDALLQHAKTLLHLPRPTDSAEEEDEFALQAQANVLRLRALKTFYMAWYYLPTQNVKAAWALVEHSSQLCNRAQEEIAACDQDMLHAEEYLEELEGLPYDSLRAAIRAASYLQTGSGTGASRSKGATQRPLLLRLEEEDPGMVLAGELAPIPLPCKPVFYDLALNDTLDTANSLDLLQQYVDKHTVLDEPDANNTKTRKGFLGSLFG